MSLLARYVTHCDVCSHVTPYYDRAVMKTPEQGGDTLVHAVMDPDLVTRGSGLHLENHRFFSAVKNKDYPH